MCRAATLLLGLLLAGSAGAGEDLAARALPVLRGALDDPDRGVRYAAALAIEEAGPDAAPIVPDLARRLDDPEWCVRVEAVRALFETGPPGRVRTLEAGRSEDPVTRIAAAVGLAGYGSSPERIAFVDDPDPMVRLAACRILLRFPGPPPAELVRALRGFLDAEDVDLRLWAAARLGEKLGDPGEKALRVLFDVLRPEGDGGKERRRRAAEAFRAMGEAALPFLRAEEKRWIGDTWARIHEIIIDIERDPRRRRPAAEPSEATPEPDPPAPPLSPLPPPRPLDAFDVMRLVLDLRDGGRDVRCRAAIDLARAGPAAVPALTVALGDPNWRVRRYAARSLGEIGPASAPAVPALVGLLTDDTIAVGFAAADALPRIGPAVARPLAEAVREPHYGRLAHAERIFERLGPDAAPAVGILADLLTHPDVNLREVAAKALGDVGPAAAPAIPDLARALRDHRISVRGRAMVALGRIGPVSAPAILHLAADPDARVRAGAVYALGWILGAARGSPPAVTDVRLPVAEPGPAAESGLVPTDEQIALARRAAADPKLEVSVDVLRAALRLSDLSVAVPCAARLKFGHLDAWEAERAVELLLPEVFQPGTSIAFYPVYEYLASSEVAWTLHYLARSALSEQQVDEVAGMLHRIVRWDVLPEYHRLEGSRDAWVVEGRPDLRMARWWSDRYRPGEGEQPGLPPALRKMMETGWLDWAYGCGWLNDTEPAPEDAALLIDYARRCEAWTGEGEQPDLHAVIRAMSRLDDEATAQHLAFLIEDAVGTGEAMARAALARRGHEGSLAKLVEDAATEWRALSLLLEFRPDVGARVLRDQLFTGEADAPAWEITEEDGFYSRRWNGDRWDYEVFLGLEEAALAAGLDTARLARIAVGIPGCRTARMAREILRRLAAGGPPLESKVPWPERRTLAFIDSVDHTATIAVLRGWARDARPGVHDLAIVALGVLGDPQSAGLLVRDLPKIDRTAERFEDWPTPWLGRSPSPVVEAWLTARATRATDADDRHAALVDLAFLYGVPDDMEFLVPYAREPYYPVFRDLTLAGRPVEALVSWQESEPDPDVLGALGTPIAEAMLLDLATRRDEDTCYPKVAGWLATLGDPDFRREFWSAIRAGRYRWMEWITEYPALTLGWSPETYPQLAGEMESDCCRGGYVARMFEKLIGDDNLSWEPTGQDATPARSFRAWLDLFGGRFVPSRLSAPYDEW